MQGKKDLSSRSNVSIQRGHSCSVELEELGEEEDVEEEEDEVWSIFFVVCFLMNSIAIYVVDFFRILCCGE